MPHKRTGSTASADISKDGPTAASIRRERKRAIDRESQRLSRARTRAYIAQLEQTIEELNNSKANSNASVESSSVSISQLKQQCEENRKLKAMIGRIHRMTQEVVDATSEPSPEERPSDGSPSNDAAESNPGESECSASPTMDHDMCHEIPVPESAEVPSPFDFREQCGVPAFNNSLRDNAWTMALASVTQNTGLLKNHFEEITEHLQNLELSDPSLPYTGAEDDDDIVIRACLHGWGEAKRRHSLDLIWSGIEALDQIIFCRARVFERVASLRMLRSMIMRKISPVGQPPREVPDFMLPSKIQSSVDHPSIIDYFVWSDLRDALILANAQFASDLSTAWFATNLKIEWNYRVQDACKFNIARDMYSFSAEFENTFKDVNAWISPFGSHSLNSGGAVSKTFSLGSMDPFECLGLEAQNGLTVC